MVGAARKNPAAGSRPGCGERGISISLGKPATRTKRVLKMINDAVQQDDAIAINEVQLVLAEKRTSLSVMRTGIAVLALPMSVMSLLIATSKHYDAFHVMHLLVPLGALNLALIILGAYLIVRPILRMRRYDQLIHRIKRKHSVIGKFIE